MSTYSHQDFTNQSLVNEPAEAFSGTTIIGSCFYQEGQARQVFPAGATRMTFIGCNLDNVILPLRCRYVECSNRRIRVVDGEDWVVDARGKDVSPIDPDVAARRERPAIPLRPETPISDLDLEPTR